MISQVFIEILGFKGEVPDGLMAILIRYIILNTVRICIQKKREKDTTTHSGKAGNTRRVRSKYQALFYCPLPSQLFSLLFLFLFC